MPATGAGWVNLGSWLAQNKDAGAAQQQAAIAQANQNAAPSDGGRFGVPSKKGEKGTSWSPATVQSLVHGSMWDAGLAQQQMGGQAGGHLSTVGSGSMGDPGEFDGQRPGQMGGPRMTKWTAAQTQGAPMYSTVGGGPANPATMTTGTTGQASGTGSSSYEDKPDPTSLMGLWNFITGHGDQNRGG